MSSESEAEFLERQTAEATAAIGDTLKAIQANLKDAANVRAWTQQYPWWAIGAAALTGFAAAAAITPRKGESLADRLADYVPDLAGSNRETVAQSANGDSPPPRKSTVISSLLATFGDALKTTIQSAVVAAVTTKAQQPPSENGAPAAEAPSAS